MPFALVCCQLRFCFVLFFFLAFMLLLSVFKAASLDGHMAFLVAVHYVIFLLEILYASLENKFFFFFFFFFVVELGWVTVRH